VSQAHSNVAVLMPIHGSAPFLEASLLSVAAEAALSSQRGISVEVLLVLDRPSKEAERTVAAFEARSPDVRVLETTKPGIAQALNCGIAAARSTFIARLDSDDLMLPGRLESQVRAFDTKDSPLLVGGQFVRWSNGRIRTTSNLPLDSARISRALHRGVHAISHSSVMIPTSVLRRNGGYADVHLAEDWDLFLRLSQEGPLNNLERSVIVYRFHGTSETGKQLVSVHKQIRCVILEHRATSDPSKLSHRPSSGIDRGVTLLLAYSRAISQVAYRRSLASSSTSLRYLWLACAALLDPVTSMIRVGGQLRGNQRRTDAQLAEDQRVPRSRPTARELGEVTADTT